MAYVYDESYIEKRNNYLTVIGITRNPNTGRKVFRCRCELCGGITLVVPNYWRTGQVKSCGCYAESLKVENRKEESNLLSRLRGMRRRCYDENDPKYKDYGGRGIRICDEWLNDKMKFVQWSLENGYRKDLSIDRIDVNGDYEPSNCRWVDIYVQANNRRPSEETDRERLYIYRGESYTCAELARKTGLSDYYVKESLKKGGDLEKNIAEAIEKAYLHNKISEEQHNEYGLKWGSTPKRRENENHRTDVSKGEDIDKNGV